MDIVLAKVGAQVNFGLKTLVVSDKSINDGDLVWNEASKSVEKCVAIVDDSIIVQFSSGMRACFRKARFQKLIEKS